MSLMSRTVPGLFGGVSQQVPALRHPTQGDLQEGAVATMKDGLSKRPPFIHVATLPVTEVAGLPTAVEENTFYHVMDYGDGGKWLLVQRGAAPYEPKVYNLETGAEATVDVTAGTSYLTTSNPRDNIRAATVADYTFLVNRSITVAESTTDTFVNPTNVAYFRIKQAIAEQTVSAMVNGVTGSYTTSGAGPHSVNSITNGLRDALIAALGAGWTVTSLFNQIVKVSKDSGSITSLACADTTGKTMIAALNEGVTKFSDLPVEFEAGYVVTVTAGADTDDDDYYVKWEAGKGWIEARKPGLPDTLVATTMPIALVRTGATSFAIEVPAWDKRLVGDDNTNPMPSFVGQKLNDVFFHRNRLGFLTGDSAVLSASGKFFRFFAETARTVLDSDPIDITSSAPDNIALDRAVPFSEGLVAFGQKGQFSLQGGEILSPKNARLPMTTAYEVNLGARPSYYGNELVFSAPRGPYSAVMSYRVAENEVSNEADELTTAVPEYIASGVTQIVASTVAKRIAVSSRGASAVWVMTFEKDGNEWRQKAWDKYPLPESSVSTYTRVPLLHWVENKLYAVLLSRSGDNYYVSVAYIDYDMTATWGGYPYVPRLDRLCVPTSITYNAGLNQTTMEVPYRHFTGGFQVLRLDNGLSDPTAFEPISVGSGTTVQDTRLTFAGDISKAGVTWLAGVKYTFRYRFTPMRLVDDTGVPVEAARVRVKSLELPYTRSGAFSVKVTPYLRDTYEYPFTGRIVGVPGLGLGQAPVSSGTFKVPVGSDPFATTVEIESTSFYPCTFPYAEWVADVLLRAKR